MPTVYRSHDRTWTTLAVVDAVDALRGLGGSARWAQLKRSVRRRGLQRAVCDGRVHRVGRTYSLPDSEHAIRRATELLAVRSHASAAEHHGFALPPEDPVLVRLTVPFKAKRTKPDDVQLFYRDLDASEVDAGVTTPLRTVVDCLRDEDLRVALAVGDSALASGKVSRDELEAAVEVLRGPGSRTSRTRMKLLDERSANAFESCARAILIEADIAGFQPQVTIRHRGQFVGRVDLADRARKIVIECDGFQTHGTLEAMTADATRHTWLVSAGWRPLRFTWYQVMFRPEWVLERVRDTVAEAERSGTTVQGRRRARKPAA